MLTIAGLTILFALLALLFFAKEHGLFGSLFFGGFIGALFGFLIVLVGSFSISEEYVPTESYPLVTLQDGSNLQGHFFLGSGYLNGVPTYVYYQTEDDGGYTLRHLSADLVTVYEEDRDNAVMVVLESRFVNQDLTLFFFEDRDYRYEFHVPEGTILRLVQLDGQ